MLFDSLVISLCFAGAIAAPYPAENGIDAAAAVETFPGFGSLKMPVCSQSL